MSPKEKPLSESDKLNIKKHYEDARFDDWDLGSLLRLRARVEVEVMKRTLDEIMMLEIQANELRSAIGYRMRKPWTEKPLKS